MSAEERHQLCDRDAAGTGFYSDDRAKSHSPPAAAAAASAPEDADWVPIADSPAAAAAAEPLSKPMILLLNLSFLGLNLMFLLLSVEVVPAQVQAMVGSGSKGSVLGAMVAGGAVLTLLCGPLVGMWSDRMTCSFGRRRPIIVLAGCGLCIGLVGMALSSPQVNFKELRTDANHSEIDDMGICTRDLTIIRCKPYFNGNNKSFVNFLRHLSAKKPLPNPNVGSFAVDDEILTGNLGLFIPFYYLVTISYVCAITPYNALIADKVHPSQRGLSSGVMGGMILLGNICGAALGIFLNSLGVICTYLLVVCILAACIIATVLSVAEPPAKDLHPPLTVTDVAIGFWMPLKEHDFRWVFITRFLMQQGLSTTVGFLEYWLADMVRLPHCWNPAKGVSMVLIPLLCSAAAASVVSGIVSDRIGRRKPLIIAASVIMSISTSALALLRGQFAFYAAAGVAVAFGVAFGIYQAVDFALLMDVLPAERDRSRDIAVWQQALVLPQALAVPVGGILLDSFERVNCRIGLGYIILFAVTSVYFLLSGVFVTRIRRAK